MLFKRKIFKKQKIQGYMYMGWFFLWSHKARHPGNRLDCRHFPKVNFHWFISTHY